MPGKSPISKAMVRRKIRTALVLRKRTPGLSEEILHECVNELVGGKVPLQDLRDGLEYNHAEAFIKPFYDTDSDETKWHITEAGIAQDQISE